MLIDVDSNSYFDITELIIEGSPLIERSAFSDCKMTNITIKGTPIIKRYVFSGCENLERVFIGNSVTTIGSRAFADCKALENVYFSYTGLVDYTSDGISYVIGDDDDTWANE